MQPERSDMVLDFISVDSVSCHLAHACLAIHSFLLHVSQEKLFTYSYEQFSL